MPIQNTILFILILVLNGCASTSELNKRADNNEKAGDYYESIGQPEPAKEERKMVRENREDSRKFKATLVDIFFGNDDK